MKRTFFRRVYDFLYPLFSQIIGQFDMKSCLVMFLGCCVIVPEKLRVQAPHYFAQTSVCSFLKSIQASLTSLQLSSLSLHSQALCLVLNCLCWQSQLQLFIQFSLSLPHRLLAIMAPKKLKIACAGLGRMGKRHALHFLNRTPRAELVAVSTSDDIEIQWAKQHLEPFGVRLYKDYGEMLKQEGLEAVIIASVTTVYAEQTIKAIEANLHCLCKKPLSTSVEVVSSPHALLP
jgi:Oxidoreductase family, NAD-binding Rossmann fold